MQLRPIDQPDGPLNELNYYHCVVSGLPFDMPMPQVVELISPCHDSSPQLTKLRDEIGYILTAHQLHVFKEKLPQKFAAVTYFLQPLPPAKKKAADEEECCAAPTPLIIENIATVEALPTEEEKAAVKAKRAAAHDLVIAYFTTKGAHSLDLTPQEPSAGAAAVIASTPSAMKDVVFEICQPLGMQNAMPFLAALDGSLELLQKDQCADAKKLRTWLLTKAALDKAVTVFPSSPEGQQQHIGSVSSVVITPAELAWLRTQHRQFPQTPSADLVASFFVKCCHPLFTYKAAVLV